MRQAPTTVHGVHGLLSLQRFDEAGLFESDEAAQLFAAIAIAYHEELVQELGRFIEYLAAATCDDGAYDDEFDHAKSLLTRIRFNMIPQHKGTVL